MNIAKITTVTFSPAGGTEQIADLLAKDIAARLEIAVETDSFTLPQERMEERHFSSSDLVLFSVPTYAGRIPNKILPFVQTLFSGDTTPAVPVVTFGNRSYDNSLKELRNELREHGFYPVAAAAIVSRHVFSKTLGHGRPDQEDLTLLSGLSESIAASLRSAGDIRDLVPPLLPDDALPVGPYYTPLDENGDPARFLKATPVTDLSLCDHCRICSRVCPMDSVSAAHPEETTGICIKCQACVLKCPRHARRFTDPVMLSHTRMLEKNYQKRATSSVFPSRLKQK